MGLPDRVFQLSLAGGIFSGEHFKLRNAGGNNSGFSLHCPHPPPLGISIQLSAVCEALSSVL